MSAPKAFFEAKDGRYVLGVWFLYRGDGDVLLIAWRDPGEDWHIDYRFRYSRDTKVFNSQDRKNSYYCRTNKDKSEEDLTQEVDSLATFIQQGYPNLDRHIVKSDKTKDVLAVFRKAPWAHFEAHDIPSPSVN